MSLAPRMMSLGRALTGARGTLKASGPETHTPPKSHLAAPSSVPMETAHAATAPPRAARRGRKRGMERPRLLAPLSARGTLWFPGPGHACAGRSAGCQPLVGFRLAERGGTVTGAKLSPEGPRGSGSSQTPPTPGGHALV